MSLSSINKQQGKRKRRRSMSEHRDTTNSGKVSPTAWRTYGTLASLTLQERDRQTTWTFVGQCVSGLRSCVLVPDLGLAFDFGFAFEQAMNQASTVCVTHGHADHIGSLHFIAFDRKMHRLEPPTFLMPQALTKTFEQAYQAYARLNHHPAMGKEAQTAHRYTLLAAPICKTDNVVRISENANDNSNGNDRDGKDESVGVDLQKGNGTYFVRAFPVVHGVPSVGYCVFMRSKKLLPQYAGLEGKEIGQLRRSGIEISKSVETPIIAYTGDTTIDGVIKHQEWLSARILFMECTYIDVVMQTGSSSTNTIANRDEGEEEKDDNLQALALEEGPDTPREARRRKHVHEKHIAEHAGRFCSVQHLVLCHFSQRYTSVQIKAAVARLQVIFDLASVKNGGKAPRVHAFI